MRTLRRTFCALSAMACTLLLPGSPAAQQTSAETPLATTSSTPARIEWYQNVAGDGLYLGVSGPGGLYVGVKFEAGQAPYFDAVDAAGNSRPDGVYNYELTLIPTLDEETRDALNALEDPDERAAFVERLQAEGKLPEETLVQFGAFTIQSGDFLSGATIEGVLTRDQVIFDDLIVDGSICVGFDCVNGESFGFDTIRLKENNLRIKFQDTSSQAGFPSNDWQITVNDSAGGGLNKFSIDDIDGARTPFTIEAGAPNHSLYVDDGGRIGLGTSTPVVDVHVKSGNTPTMRLEQDGTSGFTPQTWDVAGNEANFFIRDATNGSTLPIRLRPGAPTSSLDIASSGDIGMGTASPAGPLHVERNISGILIALLLVDGVGNTTINGTLTQSSDVNAKENFEPIDRRELLEKVADLPITTWNFKHDESPVRRMGPMAQDFSAAFSLGDDDLHIAPLDVAAVALSAVQELDRIRHDQQEQIEELQARNADLESRLLALEKALAHSGGGAQ